MPAQFDVDVGAARRRTTRSIAVRPRRPVVAARVPGRRHHRRRRRRPGVHLLRRPRRPRRRLHRLRHRPRRASSTTRSATSPSPASSASSTPSWPRSLARQPRRPTRTRCCRPTASAARGPGELTLADPDARAARSCPEELDGGRCRHLRRRPRRGRPVVPAPRPARGRRRAAGSPFERVVALPRRLPQRRSTPAPTYLDGGAPDEDEGVPSSDGG